MTNQQILNLADDLVTERFNNPKKDRLFVGYWKSGFLDGYKSAIGLPIEESKKSAKKSIKESNLPNKVYDVLNELASNFLLDYGEFVEFERNGLEHHFDKIRELGAKLKKADMKGDDDLYQKIADEIVTIVKRANGTLNESRKSLRESNDFYFEVVFRKDVAKAKEYVKEIYNKFLKKYGYSKNDITWKLTSKGIGFSSSSENIGFDLEDYILDHMYEYGDYEFETDYELMESKKSARKSIKESSDTAEKISSEIDKSYWIDKLVDDLDKHYESMEKAWLKNIDKLSDEDILGIIDDCMDKSKTLVGKSEMLKNKMIDDLSKAYDDYIDDIDRQIRIGKSEDEVKDMIETTLENDIKMYLKLAYNNKASSNYFMVKFAEDNLI